MKQSYLDRFLNLTEKVGNKLPNPAVIFALLALGTLILSMLLSFFNVSAQHPGTQETIKIINLLSIDGLHKILLNTISNLTSFAPFGIVIVALLGVGIAEESGLISAFLRLVINITPKKFVTFIIVLCGVMSNIASDVGYVILIPLGAVVFLAVGRHPVAGLAAAFAGVSGGFTANLLIGTTDPLLAGLTQEAARIIDPNYTVTPLCNYYFMVASTFLIAILGTLITEKIIIPRLGKYNGSIEESEFKKLNSNEKKALAITSIVFLVFVSIFLIGLIPENGFLRNSKDNSIIFSPFIKGVITVVFFISSILGIIYGYISKSFKKSNDVVSAMVKTMSHLGCFIVLVFFAAQFLAFFKWSNIGVVMAVEGATLIKAIGLGSLTNIFLFIILCSIINLFIGSASAKWALLAPIFVPMFMILGYSPELVQVAYRIGDSSTNIISPMMSFFALIVMFFQKYDKNAGLGTIISIMLPYSIIFLIFWSVFLLIWMAIGLPIGPGISLYLS